MSYGIKCSRRWTRRTYWGLWTHEKSMNSRWLSVVRKYQKWLQQVTYCGLSLLCYVKGILRGCLTLLPQERNWMRLIRPYKTVNSSAVSESKKKEPYAKKIEAYLNGLKVPMQIEYPRMRIRQYVVEYLGRMEKIGYGSFKDDKPKMTFTHLRNAL